MKHPKTWQASSILRTVHIILALGKISSSILHLFRHIHTGCPEKYSHVWDSKFSLWYALKFFNFEHWGLRKWSLKLVTPYLTSTSYRLGNGGIWKSLNCWFRNTPSLLRMLISGLRKLSLKIKGWHLKCAWALQSRNKCSWQKTRITRHPQS